MAYHAQFSTNADIAVYFCDLPIRCKKGHNENANGLMCQFLLNARDLSRYSCQQFDAIADPMNGRARKMHDGCTLYGVAGNAGSGPSGAIDRMRNRIKTAMASF